MYQHTLAPLSDNDSLNLGHIAHDDDDHHHEDSLAARRDDDEQARGNSSTTSFTNNIYIDGILWGGDHIDSQPITYSFWNDPDLDNDFGDIASGDVNGIAPIGEDIWNKATKDSVELAFTMWSNVANLDFEKVSDDSEQADLSLMLVGTRDLGKNGFLGLFWPPGTPNAGIGYLNHEVESWNSNGLPQGSSGFATILHEIGHGLGLAHPHDNGGDSPKYPGVVDSSDTGKYGLNQGVYTTMSYNDGLDGNASLGYGNQGTPMALDIAAIQHLYGANQSYNTGDNVYELPGSNQVGTYYSSIWDSGGTDTISAQGVTLNTIINLNEAPLVGANAGGYLSKAEGIEGGFTIAHDVTIENAIGGSGDDRITGNDADNVLEGDRGADELIGNDGDDSLMGQQNNDLLAGGFGNDSLYGGQDRDKLYGQQDSDRLYGGQDRDRLYGGQQSDRLYGGEDRDRLYGGQDDDLLKGGQGRDDLHGGQGDDRLFGGADNDRLVGGDGDDVLYGNGGADLFIVAAGKGTDVIKDFDIFEDRLALGSGLSFDDLTIVQQQNRTVIEARGAQLALLPGVDASQLTSDQFEVA
ncbi:MAG: M10 family metallopeptidase [Cyanobacteria bacterium P01_F01_bin.150]